MAKNENKHKPTAADWDKIRIYFIRGESMEFIMSKVPDVDIKPDTIMNRMQKEGMVKKRREINNTVIDKLTDEVAEEKEKNSKACIKAYKKGLALINDLLMMYRQELDSPSPSRIRAKCTAYNMDMLMSGITKIQKGFDVAYGVDKQGKLVEKEPDVLVIEGINMDKI